MNKVFIVGSKGPYSLGGYETFVRCLSPELSKYNFEVYVTSESYEGDTRNSTLSTKINVIHLFNKKKSISPFIRILYDLYSVILAIKYKADIVYMCGYNSAWVLVIPLIFGKRTYINSDGIEWARPTWGNNIIKRYYLIFNEWLMKALPLTVISDSQSIANFLKERLNLYSHFIPYGGDSFQFSQAETDIEVLEKYQLKKKNYYFISVRIVEDNYIDHLISSFKEIQSDLVIIGKIPATSYGKKIENLLHNKIRIIDMTSMNPEYNIIRHYAKANIHSHRFGGTSPNLLEVMYLKVPIIAFDTAYSREVLGENALYYNDPETLKNQIAIFETLANETIESWLESNYKNITALYNWSEVARRTAGLFTDNKTQEIV